MKRRQALQVKAICSADTGKIVRTHQTVILLIIVYCCLMTGCIHHLHKPSYAEPPASSYRVTHFSVTGTALPERIQAAAVTPDFFKTTRVQPILGRLFVAEEYQAAPQTILLNYRFWQRIYSGNPAVIGTTLELNKQSLNIIGVLPPDFDHPAETELWLPASGGHNK